MEANSAFYAALYDDSDNENDIDNNVEICAISKMPLEEKYVELPCGHKFNFMAIYNEVIRQKRNYCGMSTDYVKYYETMCPYCRVKHHGLLPQWNGYPKSSNINSPMSKCIGVSKCIAILKSGKRKGEECGTLTCETLCKRHMRTKTKLEKSS